MNIEEDVVAVRIQKCMNDILFRAMTLLAITALKFQLGSGVVLL